jgi:hypothetical protein
LYGRPDVSRHAPRRIVAPRERRLTTPDDRRSSASPASSNPEWRSRPAARYTSDRVGAAILLLWNPLNATVALFTVVAAGAALAALGLLSRAPTAEAQPQPAVSSPQ